VVRSGLRKPHGLEDRNEGQQKQALKQIWSFAWVARRDADRLMGVGTFFTLHLDLDRRGMQHELRSLQINHLYYYPNSTFPHDLPCQCKPYQVYPLFLEPGLANSATWGHISVRKIRWCVREAQLILMSLNE
jgi:hypothetical protein